MFSKLKFHKSITTLAIIWAFVLNSLTVQSQNVVTSFDLSGGSGAIVLRDSYVAKRKTYVATKINSQARRTVKQKRATRRTVVRQSRTVARNDRTRRNTQKITPKQFTEIKIESKTAEEASKIFTGAGEYFVENGDVQKAAEYLEQAVKFDDNNKDAKLALSEAYTTLGDTALEAEDFEKAQGYYEFALKYDDKNASAYAGLGQVYDEADDNKNAKANYEKALAVNPDFKQVFAPLGILYYQEHQYEKSEEFIKKALADDANNPETLYFVGLLRYLAEDYKAALNALEKSISLDKENGEAYHYLGATYDKLNEPAKAIANYEKATQLDPDYVNAWFDLGVAYYNQERYDDAIKAYDKAISLNTNKTEELQQLYTDTYENRGDTYSKQADAAKTLKEQKTKIDQAAGDYNNVYFQKKNDAEFLGKYGLLLSTQAAIYERLNQQTKAWDSSLKYLEQALASNPDAINYTNLGFVNYRIGHKLAESRNAEDRKKATVYLQKAKDLLQKAVSMNPSYDEAPLLNLGATYIDLGEYTKAVETLEKAAKKKKDWNILNFLIGIAYARDNKLKESSKYLNTAVDNDRDNFQFLNALADVEVMRKDKREIKKVVERLKKLGTEIALDKAKRLERMLK
ncbi:MAG: tetratricopeptide repeat protein [Aridibacter sp.]